MGSLFSQMRPQQGIAQSALDLSKGRDVEYGAAFACLFQVILPGRRAQSTWKGRSPEDTSVQFSYLPTLTALSALKQSKPSHAADLLQIAASYEQAIASSNFFGFFGTLYPAYMRGEAYLAAHRVSKALPRSREFWVTAAWFSAIRWARWPACNWAGPTLCWGKELRAAMAAYQDFLALWKDADPES
jgi:hypothetical protein